MEHLEINMNAITTFFAKQELGNAISLLGAASKGDEEVIYDWIRINCQ